MHRFALMLIVVAVHVTACGDDAGSGSTAPATETSASPAQTDAPPATTAGPATTIDPIAKEFGAPEVSGDPLPPAVQEGTDPAVGMPAPVAAGEDYDGTPVTIGAGDSVQAVMFLAHWCPHCQDELPEIVSWLDETGGVDGVEFVLVTSGVDPNRPNFPPSAWIEAEGWTEPVLRDSPENVVFSAYGGSSIPFWVFLESDGTVATRVLGGIGAEEVERILGEMGAGA